MSETPSWQQLLDLLKQWDASGLESASLTIGDVSLSVSRTGQVSAPAASPVAAAPAPAAAAVAAPPAPALAPTPAAEERRGTVVEAPMIGVFYRSPSPGKPAYIEPGAKLEAETTIGIIEVMKLMNPVVAGLSGTLIDFDVADGEQIEFGQALARIDPS